VEVPCLLEQERPVQVQEIQMVDVVTQVAKPYTEFIDKSIPRIETQAAEKVVEVPQTLKQELIVEVPQVQVAEAIREVAEPAVQQSSKTIPKVQMEYIERVVKVESRLQQPPPAVKEVIKEVVKEVVREVHVPVPMIPQEPVRAVIPQEPLTAVIPQEPVTVIAQQPVVQGNSITASVAGGSSVSASMARGSTGFVTTVQSSPPSPQRVANQVAVPKQGIVQSVPSLQPGQQLRQQSSGMVVQAGQMPKQGMVAVPQQRPGVVMVKQPSVVLQQPKSHSFPPGQQVRPTTAGAAAHGASLFDLIDKNHDGVITRDEMNQALGGGGPPAATLPPKAMTGAVPGSGYPKQPMTMPPVVRHS